MLKGRSLDHIGIASIDVEADVRYYVEVLGFRIIGHFGECYFIQNGGVTYEIYNGKEQPEAAIGKIDHIAYTSRDIEQDYAYALEQGYEITTQGIESIDRFWDHGIRYFKIRTPGGEQVEFNQIL